MKIKLDKKLDAYLKKYSDGVTESQRSDYYQFGSHIIRVSDHISRNSDGHFSIIVDRNNNYMIHDHHTNGITVANYDKIKALIRTMGIRRDLGVSIENQFDTQFNSELIRTMSGKIQSDKDLRIKSLKDQVDEMGKTIAGLKMNFKKYNNR